MLDAFSLLDVVELASAAGSRPSEVAGVYFALSERFEVDRMLGRITALPRDDRWAALARMALRYDLYGALAGLTGNVLRRRRAHRPGRADRGLAGGQRRGLDPGPSHAGGDRGRRTASTWPPCRWRCG